MNLAPRAWTPWGPVQDSEEVAPGILRVSTASHGGLWLCRAIHEAIQTRWPTWRTYAGGAWYEEDCDAAVPVLHARRHFDGAALVRANQIARSPYLAEAGRGWPEIAAWLDSADETAIAIRGECAAWRAAHADQWEPGSCWSPECGASLNSWGVMMRRISDGAAREVVLPSYPAQSLYTTEQLDALEREAKTPKGGRVPA